MNEWMKNKLEKESCRKDSELESKLLNYSTSYR